MYKLFVCLLLLIINTSVNAQEYIYLKICDSKTTHLIFPSKVKYFDYGSEDVAVEETLETNIIKLKSVITDFEETNLTVMTEDNIFYSFILLYDRTPKTLNYFIKEEEGKKYTNNIPAAQKENVNQQTKGNLITKSLDDINIQQDLKIFDLLKKVGKDSFLLGTKKHKITLVLNELYVDNESLYFIFDAINETAINYDIDYIKFFIKSKKKSKQTSIQDIEITPINHVNIPKVLINKSTGLSNFAFVLNKFTVADSKKFVIEIGELNGERSIELEIDNKILLSAKKL